MPSVILTDERGTPQGTADLIDAHSGEGKLHKAFSVFVVRDDTGELLMQQRSPAKMLFPLAWANTCCGNLRTPEPIVQAGERRLQEELGFTCTLEEIDAFVYKAKDPNGRGIEYEHDSILLGHVPGEVTLNVDPEEAADVRWMSFDDLERDAQEHPEKYGPWFVIALPIVSKKIHV